MAHRAAAGEHDPSKDVVWRPNLQLYVKICIVYRAAHFMPPEQISRFIAMVREEIDACGSDPDAHAEGLLVLAEISRQTEDWDETFRLAAEGLDLEPRLSTRGKKTGVRQFLLLGSAYAHYAQGSPSCAKDVLAKLDCLGNDYFFHRNVEFKATNLRCLLGVEFSDTYISLSVPARRLAKLVADIPEGGLQLDWDFVLEDHTINFTAVFLTEESQCQIEQVEQHNSENGPHVGSWVTSGPGRLELIFDNSFSLVRGKTVQCRLQPTNLLLAEEK